MRFIGNGMSPTGGVILKSARGNVVEVEMLASRLLATVKGILVPDNRVGACCKRWSMPGCVVAEY